MFPGFLSKKESNSRRGKKTPSLTRKKIKKKLFQKKIEKQANSQPQGIAVAPADQMRMNVGVLNNPISGSVYAPVGEHVGM